METTPPIALVCPTSGVIFKSLMDSLSLLEESESQASKRLGSGDRGRTGRRYFQVAVMSDETRRLFIKDLADLFSNSMLVTDIAIGAIAKERASQPPAEILYEAVANWAMTWDRSIRETCDGWPFLSQHLGAFVLGRVLVIDLAIRLASWRVLCGDIAGSASSEENWEGELLDVLERALRSDAIGRSPLTADHRTVQRWRSGAALPSLKHLDQLARAAYPKDPDSQGKCLRSLRLWRCRQLLRDMVMPLVGEAWCTELFRFLERLTHEFWLLMSEIATSPEKWDTNKGGLEVATRKFVLHGLEEPPTQALLRIVEDRLRGDEDNLYWCGELVALSSYSVPDRLLRAFRVIGNWPEFLQIWEANRDKVNLQAVPTPEKYALRIMNPVFAAMMSAAASGHLSPESLGVPPASVNERGNQWAIALDLLRDEQYEEALPLFRRLLTEMPDNAELHAAVGECLWRTHHGRNYAEAEDHLRRAIELRPDWDHPWVEIGIMWHGRGMPDMAAFKMGKSPEAIRSKSNAVNRQLGISLLADRQYKAALASFMQATELDPKDGGSWDGAAECAFQCKMRPEGEKYAKTAAHLGFRRSLEKWLAGQ